MKSQEPPLAFFLEAGLGFIGWEKMDIRPEQELVVKYEGWELIAVRRGMIGVSIVPLGDLSGSGELMEAKVAAFLFSNSILSFFFFFLFSGLFLSPLFPWKRVGGLAG